MKNSKRWIQIFLIGFLIILLVTGVFMIVIDPYFHYHKPIPGISYTLDNARYQNNGIVRHFDYDAIITGSSMTECFKTSELDALFDVHAIKVPYSGGSYKEVNDNLKVAVASQPKLKMIVRGLDCNRFFNDKDDMDYTDYPTYLYDNNLLNDVNYLFNKEVLFTALQDLIGYNRSGQIEMSFDAYCNWNDHFKYGADVVNAYYKRDTIERATEMLPFTESDIKKIDANFEENVIKLARENPDIQFYLYFPPYSIYYMDYWMQLGELSRQLKAEKHIIELLLPYENIHLYSFYMEHEVVNDLSNYRDVAHHKGDVNSQILLWMKEGKGLLSVDNYEAYCDAVWEYYMNFDYDALFR